MRRVPLLLAALVASSAVRAEDAMQIDRRLLFAQPDLAKPGQCVMYREGGAGWILTEPVYWLKGTTVAAEVRKRKIDLCPDFGGKPVSRLSRAEFNQLAKQQPCVAKSENVKEGEFAVIRLRIDDWETPFAQRTANAGRLHRGHYLDRPLVKGEEIELDADLLGACS